MSAVLIRSVNWCTYCLTHMRMCSARYSMTFNRSLKKDRAAPTLNNGASGAWLPWIFLLFGIAIMYVPSMIDLFRGAWSSDQNAHGPIVMGMAFYFLYFRARLLLINGQLKPTPSIGLG